MELDLYCTTRDEPSIRQLRERGKFERFSLERVKSVTGSGVLTGRQAAYASKWVPKTQRLYSTFARGWPGAGLLCLRLTAAAAAIQFGAGAFGTGRSVFLPVAAGAAAVLLSAGLWTPVAGGALAAVALWSGLFATCDPWAQILLAGISVSLALLGPGAWSMDARLFGRKRLIHEP